MMRLLAFLLVCCVGAEAAQLEIVIVKQKVNAAGRPYGGQGGVYFKVKEMQPLLMYKIQYSKDLKKWHDLEQVATWYNTITSALWHWHELPKDKCFFRIIEAW
jgi:hypothetical protein